MVSTSIVSPNCSFGILCVIIYSSWETWAIGGYTAGASDRGLQDSVVTLSASGLGVLGSVLSRVPWSPGKKIHVGIRYWEENRRANSCSNRSAVGIHINQDHPS